MVEVLQFIFGGTALWGVARYAGVCLLLVIVMGCLAVTFGGRRK